MRSRSPVTTLESEMRRRARNRLIDEMIDTYVDWHEQSAAVELAYLRWSVTPSPETELAFLAYREALDREEMASTAYEQIIRRVIAVLERDHRRHFTAVRRGAGGRASSRRPRPRRVTRTRGRRSSPPAGVRRRRARALARRALPRAGAGRRRGRRLRRSGARRWSRRRAT
jgi:hypothetical protein